MSRRYWYFYTGTGLETDPANYATVPGSPVGSCAGGKALCTIYALPNQINPAIPKATEIGSGGTLTAYIVQAKLISSSYPTGGQRPYVYTFPTQ